VRDVPLAAVARFVDERQVVDDEADTLEALAIRPRAHPRGHGAGLSVTFESDDVAHAKSRSNFALPAKIPRSKLMRIL
jgi:hypothetical protein